MTKTIEQITVGIDSLILDLLGPLRRSKTINQTAFTKLKEEIDYLLPMMETQMLVPKELVGKLWFIFTSMLSEAEHARTNREEIEILAWDIEERLRRLFGPKY